MFIVNDASRDVFTFSRRSSKRYRYRLGAPGSGRSSIVGSVNSAPLKSGRLNGSLPQLEAKTRGSGYALLEEAFLASLWREAEASHCGLDRSEFAEALYRSGEKCNYNLPAGAEVTKAKAESFWRGLRLKELAIAYACAAGYEKAWHIFLAEYREPLIRAAIAITGSSGNGQELADSLYSELYGLQERDGVRRSPLRSYSGRGSLLGWLRATLAQRHVDQYRRKHREAPLEDWDFAATEHTPVPEQASLTALQRAVATSLRELDSEERFMLSAWFLDGRTLQEIARLLRVHEATVSRRIKRLTADLRKATLRSLQSAGLSKSSAAEALGTDPRDLTIKLRKLLQNTPAGTFQEQAPQYTAVNPGQAVNRR